MTTSLKSSAVRAGWFAQIFGAGLAMAAVAAAQSPAPLKITSPANGTIITAGQALAVTVVVAPGSGVGGVAIVGQDPLGVAGPLTGSPATFYLTIPATAPPGSYSITAAGPNAPGVLVTSAPLTVDVERVDTANSISVQPVSANLRFPGDSIPLKVIGTFTDGMLVDLTRSSQLMIASANSNVATVSNGSIIATRPGTTNINVRYGSLTGQIAVTVPNFIRGDLNGDGRVDQSDLNIIMAALNTPANGPNDARDLNHDGKINALDARILVTLCTHPGCATN